MTNTFLTTVLRPAKITRHLAARTTAGTVSLSGFTQRVATPTHAWVITYDGIVVGTRAQLLLWDAYEAALDGAANPILVPLVGEGNGATPGATVGTAAVGATTIVVSRAVAIDQGSHFSIGERLYRVASLTGPSGTNYTLTIRPPLRTATTGGLTVEFNLPVCKCRAATDDEWILEIDSARIGVGKIKWLEDPN